MKTIYNALIERLKTLPKLKYIDMDTGQLEVPFSSTKRPPLAYPAILISIAVTRTKELTERSQLCSATVTLRLADDTPMRTAAHRSERTASMEIYDLVEEVRDTLQGFTGGEAFSPLSRVSQERERISDGLFVCRMTFETTFIQ